MVLFQFKGFWKFPRAYDKGVGRKNFEIEQKPRRPTTTKLLVIISNKQQTQSSNNDYLVEAFAVGWY